MLKKNLLVSYNNWSVTEANAKRYDSAIRICDEALRRFPDDANLKKARDYALGMKQRGG